MEGTLSGKRLWHGWYWLTGLLLALSLDGTLARLFAPYHLIIKRSTFAEEIREGGHFVLTLLIALLLWVLHKDRWRAALLLLMSAIAVGAARAVIALAVGRVRPIVQIAPFELHPFNFDPANIFHAHNLSFPSGHASLAFAVAAALAYLLPQGRWLFLLGASLVGLERIGELAHYASDVVAGALLGMLVFRFIVPLHGQLCQAIDGWMERVRTRIQTYRLLKRLEHRGRARRASPAA